MSEKQTSTKTKTTDEGNTVTTTVESGGQSRVALASLRADGTLDGPSTFIDPEMGEKELAERKEMIDRG